MLSGLMLMLSAVRDILFANFSLTCDRRPAAPLERFWGARPHPDASVISSNALWHRDDPNIAILPKWESKEAFTMPFVDTHVAVRFLGGVSNHSAATSPKCADAVLDGGARDLRAGVRPGEVWCDLVVREQNGTLRSRFDLVRSRLDRYFDNGIDVMIVLDNVPWAFVNTTTCANQTFGCQYLPPDDPQEFAAWVEQLAAYVASSFGDAGRRVRWRLGTEANGPRWSDRGKYFDAFLLSYKLVAAAVRAAIPGAQVGASNWVEVVGGSGDLSPNGTDAFQWKVSAAPAARTRALAARPASPAPAPLSGRCARSQFYSALAAAADVPLDWISVSHYGGHSKHPNFPGADYVQRTPSATRGAVELQATRALRY